MVSDKLLLLKQQTNGITSNPILDAISIEVVQYFENNSATNPLYREKIEKIEAFIDKPISIEIGDAWKSLFNEYIEAYAFWYCSRKVFIERVPEATENRPDFKLRYKSKEYYLEVKSPFYMNTDINYRKNQQEGLEAKIDIEKQLSSGSKIAIGEQIHQPYNNGKAYYKPNSKQVIIEGIINKVRQNYKAGQYDLGDTLLLVDLRQLGLSAKPKNSAMPVYLENAMGKSCICSGELWNASFIPVGNLIYYFPMDYPLSNIEGTCSAEGLLVQFPKIRAIIYQTESMHNENCTLVGFTRSQDIEMIELLEVLCDYYNDDQNSRRMYLEH